MYFSCIFDEHTYMDLPSIFADRHCMYIVCIYCDVLALLQELSVPLSSQKREKRRESLPVMRNLRRTEYLELLISVQFYL